jgi:hypothetical protein
MFPISIFLTSRKYNLVARPFRIRVCMLENTPDPPVDTTPSNTADVVTAMLQSQYAVHTKTNSQTRQFKPGEWQRWRALWKPCVWATYGETGLDQKECALEPLWLRAMPLVGQEIEIRMTLGDMRSLLMLGRVYLFPGSFLAQVAGLRKMREWRGEEGDGVIAIEMGLGLFKTRVRSRFLG